MKKIFWRDPREKIDKPCKVKIANQKIIKMKTQSI
jgi:hypothetical protein